MKPHAFDVVTTRARSTRNGCPWALRNAETRSAAKRACPGKD